MELDLKNQTQLYLGLFEREVHKWLAKLSVGIKSAIDIGSGEGEYALFFFKKTNVEKIFVFEPMEQKKAQFIVNLQPNNLADNDRLKIYSNFVGSSKNSQRYCLDSLVSLISFPCLIKIDVDGPEADILDGAAKLLERPDTRWLIETHSEELEEQCIEKLNKAGFMTKIIPNAWWRWLIPELRPSSHNRWLIAAKVTTK